MISRYIRFYNYEIMKLYILLIGVLLHELFVIVDAEIVANEII